MKIILQMELSIRACGSISKPLKIIWPDGTVLIGKNSIQTMVAFINWIGPDKVASCRIERAGVPLVSKNREITHGVKVTDYTELNNGFIHVHHINFISTFKGKKHEIDPANDLIPVCPNCHAMLHRKVEGTYLTPEQLKKFISDKL